MEYLHFLVIFLKTQRIGSAPGIEPATSRSAVKRSTDGANPVAVISSLYLEQKITASVTLEEGLSSRKNIVVYSYFKKGCRKKCARQSWKVVWVILSSLFFKEISKNGTRGHGRMFASAKGKQQK